MSPALPKINPAFQALIPPLSSEEKSQLEANIVADGCRDALVTWRGYLLDGHNRLEICQRLKLPFDTNQIELPDEDAAKDWIDTNQLGRRNLKPDQLSYIRGRLYNRKKKAHGGDRKSSAQSEHLIEKTAEAIAKEHGVSPATVRRDGKRAEAIDKLAETKPEEAQAIRDGVKRFIEVKRAMRVAEVKESAKFPDAKYRVLYADPPWPYEYKGTQGLPLECHYHTMSLEQICGMPILAICEENAVLFLWVTSPFLFDSKAVFEAWGFNYKACFVWDKVKHNLGHYNSVRHEFLLICTRGACTPDNLKLFDSVQSIERSKNHSQKPEEFRCIIDALYPHGKRIELFARGKAAKGWDVYGNEVE